MVQMMMKLHAITRILCVVTLALAVGCSGSKAQEKTDTMTDEQYGDAMEKEHADDEPVPSGAEEQEGGAAATNGEEVQYGTVGEQNLTGYLAKPEGAEAGPAVILIHEWWGLNDNIRAMADKLASQGYTALAVDMYGGQVAESPDKAKKYMSAAMADPQSGVQNLIAAREFLEEKGAEKVGVIGWCFGGGWALEAGITQGTELDAVVMYYGRVKTEQEEVAPLAAPLLGLFGAEDTGIPPDQVKKFEAALDTAGEDAQIHIYEGAGHAFANPSGQNYQKEAAEDAWQKTLAFFDEHLKG